MSAIDGEMHFTFFNCCYPREIMKRPELHREFDRYALFRDEDLASVLRRLVNEQALAMPILAEGRLLEKLVLAASTLRYRPAKRVVGSEKRRVYQEFGYCDQVLHGHLIRYLAQWLELRINRALSTIDQPPMAPGFTINDVVCQEYSPGELGISAHRDHVMYKDLIVLVVLNGRGRYFVCADRQGREEREIDHGSGWMILMPAPGYAGREDRPFHLVRDVTTLRYSVGLRHDSLKP